LTAVSTAGLTFRGVGGQREDDLRGALADLERRPVRVGDGGLGAFVHRVERLEVVTV
jgi:hypothetical protein